MDLNDRQRIFVNALLAGKSQKDAAIAAGYSERSAEACASRLMRNAKVRAEIAKSREKASEAAGLDAQRIYQTILTGLDFDPAKLFAPVPNFEGRRQLLDVPSMPLEVRRCLTGFKVKRMVGGADDIPEEIVEVKWTPVADWNAQGANVLGLNKTKHEVEAGVTLRELLEGAAAAGGKKPEGR